MGRSSSTQSVFLVERPDSKKFSYHRKLPAHLRPLMVGAVTISWKARIHEVNAPETIKISLGTATSRRLANAAMMSTCRSRKF